jgi:hypothetical protein
MWRHIDTVQTFCRSAMYFSGAIDEDGCAFADAATDFHVSRRGILPLIMQGISAQFCWQESMLSVG